MDADRAARDVGKIAEEVLQHLTILPKSNVKVALPGIPGPDLR